MTIYHVNTMLPSPNQWVLARYTGGNWGSCGAINPGGQNWTVVMFLQGLSLVERVALPDGDRRKITYHSEDQFANNNRPFCWKEFGPGCLLGQDVDYWTELPEVP